MADKKITELAEATQLKDNDILAIVQEEQTKKIKASLAKPFFCDDKKIKESMINLNVGNINPIKVEDSSVLEASLEILGNTIQNGEPTSKNPVELKNVDEDIAIIINNSNMLDLLNCTKNQENCNIIETTKDDITFQNTESTEYSWAILKIKLPAGVYTIQREIEISGNQVLSTGKIAVYDDAVKEYYGSAERENKNFIVTLPKTQTYSIILYLTGGERVEEIITVKFKNIQIEPGEEASSYNNYLEKTKIIFPLESSQILRKGDFICEDGINLRTIAKELNGTENWILDSQKTNYSIFKLILEDELVNIENEIKLDILSNYFIAKDVSTTEEEGIFHTGNSVYISYMASTLEEFKAFLNSKKEEGVPVIIEFPTTTITKVPLTDSQREIYNKLKNIELFKFTNIIYTDFALLNLNYIADTKKYIDNKYNNLAQQLLNL